MGTKVDTLYYDLEAVDAKFRASIAASAGALGTLEQAGQRAKVPIGALNTAMQTAAAGATRLEETGDRAGRSLSQLPRLLQGIGLALGVRQLIEYADGWQLVTARLSLVTRSSEELRTVQAALFQIAQDTRQDITATVDLYARMARSTKELGLTQQQLLQITKAVNEAFVVSGASSEEASAAVLQLGQALASGTLRGDELRSVLEQAPRLAQAIATGMGTTVGQLRTLGAAGQLTSKQIADAILDQADAIDREFGKIPLTIGQAMTQVENAIKRFVGEESQATAAGQTLASGLRLLAENIALVANAALALGAVQLARWLSAVAERVLAMVATQRAAITASQEQEAQVLREAASRKAQAAAALEAARATEAETAATVANLQATRAAILLSREEAVAKLAAAQAAQRAAVSSVPISQLAPLGGAAVERELARRAAATRAVSTATRDLAQLGTQQARVEKALAEATAGAAAAQRATAAATAGATAATVAGTAALEGMTIGARVAAGAMALLRGAMAFLGGPIGVAIAAVAGVFAILSHNAHAAQEETEKFKNSLRGMSPREYQAMIADLEQRIGHAQDVLNGTTPDTDANGNPRRGFTAGRVRELQQEIVLLKQRLDVVRAVAKETAAAEPPPASPRDAQAIADLQQRLHDLRFEASQPDELAKVREELRKLVAEAQKAGMAGTELAEFKRQLEGLYELQKQRVGKTLLEQLQDELAKVTPTLVDDMQREIDKLRAQRPQLQAAGATPDQLAQFDRLVALKEQLRDIQGEAEATDRLIAQIGTRENQGRADDFAALSRREDMLRLQLAETTDEAAQKAIQQQIEKIEAERAKLVAARTSSNSKDTKQSAEQLEKERQRIRDQAQSIRDAAGGALELARAFGLVGDETARVLQNIVNIAAGIGPLLEEIKLFKSGAKDASGNPLASIGSIVGAALPIVGGLAGLASGLFGESPEEKQRREELAKNTEALQQLTRHVGDLANSNATGHDIAAAQGLVPQLQAILNGRSPIDLIGNSQVSAGSYAAFAAQGFTRQQVDDLAKEFGITLNGTAAAWQQFVTALQTADLQAYTDTLSGALQQLHDSFEVYDITDPVEKVRRTIATLANAKTGIPAIAKAFAGLDVGNAADREAAIARLQQLFEALGNGQVSAADLNGASLTDARQQLIELIQELRDGAGGPGGTGGFNESRTITEVTGSRLAGLLTTANVWAEMTAKNTAIIAQALAGTQAALPAIQPPALPATSSTGAGAVINLTLNLTLPGVTTAAQATPIGQALIDPVIGALNTALGKTQTRQQRAQGSVLFSHPL